MRFTFSLIVLITLGNLVAIREFAPEVADSVFRPLTQETLTVDEPVIDLGTVSVNDSRFLSVSLKNHEQRTVRLLRPKAQCSCVTDLLKPITIHAGNSYPMGFTFRTPSTPGEFSKDIMLRSAEKSDLIWTVTVKGDVQAPAWASPANLGIELSDDGIGEASGVVHFAESTEIERIVSSHPDLAIQLARGGTKAQTFRVKVNADQADSSSLLVFAKGGTKLTEIPIKWSKPSSLQCMPRILVVDQAVNAGGLRVTILRGRGNNENQLVLKTLVPWLEVASVKDINERVTQVQFRLKKGEVVPQDFRGHAVSAQVEGGDSPTFVSAMVST